jgi:hypothetical protein
VTLFKTPLFIEGDSIKREKRADKDHLFKGISGIDPGHFK